MKVSSVLLTLFTLIMPLSIYAQPLTESGTLKFSLSEARQYALDNSPILLNSKRDVDIAKKRIWETIATGLPQAELNGSYSYSPELAGLTQVFTGGDTTGGGGGENPFGFEINPDDLKTNFFLTGQATLLLFNGQYIVGLKASRIYADLSELADTKSKIGIDQSITVTYFTSLVAREYKDILDSTLKAIEKTLYETEQLYSNGFAESTDVDQLRILVSDIKTSLSMANRQINLMDRLLKFQMGIPIDQSIILTDQIVPLVETLNIEAGNLEAFQVEKNVDYQLLSTQEKLMFMNMQAQKALFLPTLGAFYQRYLDLDDNFFNDQSENTFGVSLNFPLLSSGQRMAQVAQRKLEFLKAQTNKQMGEENLLIQYETAMSDFISAREIFSMQKESRDLSLRIYQRSITKFTEGVGSSLDLNLAQSQYFETQGNYYNALLSFVTSKSRLESLLANSDK